MQVLFGPSRESGQALTSLQPKTTANRAAKLNCKARSLDGFFWMVQPATTAKSLVSGYAARDGTEAGDFSESVETPQLTNRKLWRETETAKRERFAYRLEGATSHKV